MFKIDLSIYIYVCVCVCVYYVCILSGIGGQNDKVYLKNFKLFRIIQKKNSLIFFKIFGGPRPLSIMLIIHHYEQCHDHENLNPQNL